MAEVASDVSVSGVIIAAVGFHGRAWRPRLTLALLALSTCSVPASPQPPAAFTDLASDFASSIAGAVAPATTVRLTFTADPEGVQADVARALASRGIRTSELNDATAVSAACAANLRERVCVAEIGRGDARRVVITTRPRAAGTEAAAPPIVALELRPLYTQRAPILDAADAGDRVIVLTPDAVVLVADAGSGNPGGRAIASKPITTGRVWPRDLRGRLRVSAQTFEAFLPGVVCRGTIAPFALACGDDIEPWPVGIENNGIAPSRNAFSTTDGFTFYEAAPLGGDRVLLVSERSALTIAESGRRTPLRAEPTDHVAAFARSCAGDPAYVAAAARTSDAGADTLRLFRIADARLEPAGSMLTLPGTLTALWSSTGAGPATAIVHDVNAGRYEAFHITLSCAR